MTTKPAVSVSRIRPDIALITMDQPGSAANVLNDQLFAELDATMAELAEQQDLRGVILYSAKPTIFVAGADLNRIVQTADWPPKNVVSFCEKGRAVMARFSRCPFVSVAAIHGACVGGGLELTLWCDCRIASDNRRTVLGLPEVKLGLVPGWAGTARLPRIASFEVAVDLITSGRLVDAETAKTMGFVDAVVPQDDLLEQAAAMVDRVATSEVFIRDRRAIMGPVKNQGDTEQITAAAAQQIVANEEIFLYAPTVVLEHLARTADAPIVDAWNSESQAMVQVYGSPASRGLLNHFFLVDRNKKQPGLVDLSLPTKSIETVAIIGAGLMGQSIAQTCLKQGIDVLLHDADQAKAEAAVAELKQAPTKSAAEIKSVTANEFAQFARVDLAIESVVETFEVKKLVLQKLEPHLSDDCLIVSNTSAIPIEKLASCLRLPGRFCGVHFCHPELMSMVEVICGPKSSEATITSAVAWVRRLRKMPVAMNDGAGFVVNRLLAAMLDQSTRLFEQGVPIPAIDEAMRRFGFRGGPFEIIDIVGVDTCMYAGRTMWEANLACVSLSPVLPKLVKHGRLGRKSSAGFYDYPDARGERAWNDEVMQLLQSYQTDTLNTEPPVDWMADRQLETISQEILAVMVLEATRIIDEEIVADIRDLDLCVIHGFSFPQHRGGLLFWADQVGLEQVKRTLYRLEEHEPKLAPSDSIKRLAEQGRGFYDNV